ncbi:single-stranded DNA-binding protein [Pseudoglutamicibacter cumminsii]|uniref:single-stranded DNA-binding protein n=1 Tax=Pseudoglutamicibacter cumminsii TaxID=156979 RepID=UPI00195966F5|nr:single-stranded DNA-binding protein [Pseudoglutamicibacter cumminsii]MBM7796862.1 single-strand DNA-binding protein [Pseudoglutamicibacter cumminsii]
MTETMITVVGNLTADPELRFTPAGVAVANFTVASTPRSYDKQQQQWVDGEALFMRCSVWRDYAENVAESLTKGARVIATGKLRARSYQDRDGDQRTAWELEVDEVGPALRYATAQPVRTPMKNSSGGQAWPGQQQQTQQTQPQQPQPQQQGWDLPAGTPQAAPPF